MYAEKAQRKQPNLIKFLTVTLAQKQNAIKIVIFTVIERVYTMIYY